MPFISDIHTVFTKTYPVCADPTRTTSGSRFYEFKQHDLMMHHFSWVRNDIGKKLRNSSAKVNWSKDIHDMIENHRSFTLPGLMKFYPEHTLTEVENIFGINVDQ